MTPAEAIAAIYAKTRRSVREYATTPSTTGNVTGPCVRGCGATARTKRGVCRACLKEGR